MKKYKYIILVMVICILSKIDLFIVDGISMEPTLQEGEILITYQSDLEIGDIVIVNSSEICEKPYIVKRITAIENNLIYIEGDNKEVSYDSRHFGWIEDKYVTGIVLYHFPGIAKR